MSCQNRVLDEDGNDVCPCGDEGLLCESCEAAEEAYWGALYRAGALDSPEQYEQDMRDAGRGHLLPP